MKTKAKAAAFILIGVLILAYLNDLVRPTEVTFSDYYTAYLFGEAFYSQPKNTVETIFLGTSHPLSAYSPMELYEKYGICSYNLSSPGQPMLMSYYWLEEAYRYHPESLKTVVLDPSYVNNIPSESAYKTSLSGMRFSKNKYHAVKDIEDTLDGFLSDTVSLFGFHTNYKNLTMSNFVGKKADLSKYRGYVLCHSNIINDKNSASYGTIGLPYITAEPSAAGSEEQFESKMYFRRIAEFCREKNIKLVMVRLPFYDSVTLELNNILTDAANEYGLDYINFNFEPYYDELNYDPVADASDLSYHMNYNGSLKITDYIGEYLVNNCSATDIRGQEKYEFMEDDLKEYKRSTAVTQFDNISDPCDYIEKAREYGDFTILMTVKDEASAGLTDEQRSRLSQMGLTQLSQIGWADSYLGVIKDGEVLYEQLDVNSEEKALSEEPYIRYEGTIDDNSSFVITSGGYFMGNISSCELNINGRKNDYSPNKRGINIVVYDSINGTVVDKTVFNTSDGSERVTSDLENELSKYLENGGDPQLLTDKLRDLYLYEMRVSDSRRVKELKSSVDETGLFRYLNEFFYDENYLVIMSVRDEASSALDDRAREIFREMGLSELSNIGYTESYAAVVNGGNVLYEQRASGEETIRRNVLDFNIVSSGFFCENVSSVMHNGVEYSPNTRGINIVVYDILTKEVIDSEAFDTYEVIPSEY